MRACADSQLAHTATNAYDEVARLVAALANYRARAEILKIGAIVALKQNSIFVTERYSSYLSWILSVVETGAIQRIEMDNREKNHDPGRGVPKGS